MRVSDIAISSDNKYLAITEIDASGINVKSQIEVFSVEKQNRCTKLKSRNI